MSIGAPIFGIDVSHWQQAIDMGRVKEAGYEFVIIKATEGPYRDGSRLVDDRYDEHTRNARAADLIVGAYHFLVETPAKAQVAHFLRNVGDVEGKIVVVDYEAYPRFPVLSPTMATLRAFVTELRARIGEHPIVVYAGQSYWEEPPPNGPITDLSTTTWDAFYPLGFEVGDPRTMYDRIRIRGWGDRWGSQEPMFWQFTSSGRVAGLNIDVNAFRGTREELLRLTGTTTPPLPQEPEEDGERPDRPPEEADRPPDLHAPSPDFEPPIVTPARILLQAGPEHDQGSGAYVRAHPTHYDFRPDIRELAERIVNLPGFGGKIWINTYRNHPPGWHLDEVSFDVWDWTGRGHAIDRAIGEEVFATIFDDPNPPWIRWCIWQGRIWSRGRGWRSWRFPEDGSDPSHLRHSHFTFG